MRRKEIEVLKEGSGANWTNRDTFFELSGTKPKKEKKNDKRGKS
jgi:hypothetical protein